MAQTAKEKAAAAKKIADAEKVSAKADAAILLSLKVDHPQWAQWIIDNPELKKIVLEWAKIPGGPTPEMIDKAIYPTKLVQEYNTFQQRLSSLKALSPGEYNYEVSSAGKWVDEEIAKQGFFVSPENRQKIIDATLLNNWGQGNSNIKSTVASYFDISKQTLGSDVSAVQIYPVSSGTASTELSKFAGIAADYGIPMPNNLNQLNSFVKQAIGPNGSEQAFTDWAKASAKMLYPFMSASIDAGATVKGWLQPIATNIANVLDISASSIDWSQPKWSSLIAKPVAQKGENGGFTYTPQSINDMLTTVKTDPQYGYDKTMTAKNSAYDLAAKIKSTFGFGA